MSKKNIPLTQKTCTNSLGTYHRAVETDYCVYFVNFEESDENGAIKMYRKEKNCLSLISDNYFASVGLDADFKEGNVTWMSPKMKKNRELYEREVIVPLVKSYLEISKKGYPSVFSEEGQRFHELEEEIDKYYVTLPDEDVAMFLEEKFEKYL
jgi:hypothetical protein